ncbi:MAG: hypothetical protein AB1413_04680 [Thermodesulfobacteriota bacterium]
MAEQDTIIQVRLPETLRSRKLRHHVGYALFALAHGSKPDHIPGEGEKRINTKIRLGQRGKKYLDELLARPGYASKNQIILHALAYLHGRPHINCNIEDI